MAATRRMLRRGGARNEDTVFVTGTVGDAALGLEVLRGALVNLDRKVANFLVDRYHLPRQRVTLGPRLVGFASAAIDASDGLLADLRHTCAAVIEVPRAPLSTAARVVRVKNTERFTTVLTGGDDYQILFTAPPAALSELIQLSQMLDVPINAIGRMESTAPGKKTQVTVLDESGEPIGFNRSGWTHF